MKKVYQNNNYEIYKQQLRKERKRQAYLKKQEILRREFLAMTKEEQDLILQSWKDKGYTQEEINKVFGV